MGGDEVDRWSGTVAGVGWVCGGGDGECIELIWKSLNKRMLRQWG